MAASEVSRAHPKCYDNEVDLLYGYALTIPTPPTNLNIVPPI
jgi:hypothetical protein